MILHPIEVPLSHPTAMRSAWLYAVDHVGCRKLWIVMAYGRVLRSDYSIHNNAWVRPSFHYTKFPYEQQIYETANSGATSRCGH